jgi:regulator of sigma E protease
VLRFSIGFGRVLWRRTFGADRTEFVLSMLPLGGYVRMLDEREADVDPADLPRAFNRRPLLQRTAIVAAGPIANLLLAVVLYYLRAVVRPRGAGADREYAHRGQPDGRPPACAPAIRIVAVAEGAEADDDSWRDVRSLDDVLDAIGGSMMDREPLHLRVTRPGETADAR